MAGYDKSNSATTWPTDPITPEPIITFLLLIIFILISTGAIFGLVLASL